MKKEKFKNKIVYEFTLGEREKEYKKEISRLSKLKRPPKTIPTFQQFFDRKLENDILKLQKENAKKLFSISVSTTSKKLDKELHLHAGRSTELRKFTKTSVKESLQQSKENLNEIADFLATDSKTERPREKSIAKRLKTLSKPKRFKINIYAPTRTREQKGKYKAGTQENISKLTKHKKVENATANKKKKK